METPKRIVTHSGSFHADDVFAVATAGLVFKGMGVERTRDSQAFGPDALLIDVGGVSDPILGRFDHHQEGGAGVRPENGIPYASFGLVWKTFGLDLCQGVAEAFEAIDRKLVSPIDAIDNGVELTENLHKGVYPYTIHDVLASFHGSHDASKQEQDDGFARAVIFASELLKREIKHALEYQTLQKIVEDSYQRAEDKQVIILDGKYPWTKTILSHPEPLFVVYPDGMSGNWTAKSVPTGEHTFERRRSFPLSWAGKKDEELQAISGIPEALFCHNGRFIAIAKTQEGAIMLARKAIKTA